MNWENTLKADNFEVKTNFPDADFWLIRVHDIETVGKPTKEFKPQYIGIKILATDKFDPQFMYYWFENLQRNQRYWYQMANPGTTNRSNIRVKDVKQLLGRLVVRE